MYLFILNILGIGFDPTAVALFVDYVFVNEQSLDMAIAIVGTGLAALCYFWVEHHIEKPTRR